MSSASLRGLDRQIKVMVTSRLKPIGFTGGAGRTFRRWIHHEGTRTAQIVEFQVGAKTSHIGKFTLNLGLFNADFLPPDSGTLTGDPFPRDCLYDLTKRLGFLRKQQPTIISRVLGRPTQPHDHWWQHSSDLQTMTEEMSDVFVALLDNGIPWLEIRTSVEAFKWALQELERRRAWKAALGLPSAAGWFMIGECPLLK